MMLKRTMLLFRRRQLEVLNQTMQAMSGGLLLLHLLDLIKPVLRPGLLLLLKKLETAVQKGKGQHKITMMQLIIRKIPKSTVRNRIPVDVREIQAVSTYQAFPSPGGLETTPSPCSHLPQ